MTYGQPDPPPPMAPPGVLDPVRESLLEKAVRLRHEPLPPMDPGADDNLKFGGVAEIAAMLGVPRSTVSMWDSRRGTNGYPEPVARLTMGPVYDLEAVRLWHAAKGSQS